MYKLLIVDDEIQTRTGLKELINWEEMNIKICGEADDGLSALPLIKKEKPDILLTDVRMHHMDGITLAHEAIKVCPQIIIVFISAYSQAEYLKQAIHLRAVDYIYKPIQLKDVLNTIKKIVGTLDEKRLQQQRDEHIARLLSQSRPLMIEQFVHALIDGRYPSPQAIYAQANFLRKPLDEKAGILAVVLQTDFDLSESDFQINAERLAVFNAIHQKYPQALICTYYNEVVCLLPMEDPHKDSSILVDFNLIRKELEQSSNINLLIGITSPREDVMAIPEAVKEARLAVERSALLKTKVEDIHIYADRKEDIGAKNQELFNPSGLERALSLGDFDKVQNMVHEAIEKIKTLKLGSDDIRKTLMLFALLTDATLKKQGLEGIDSGIFCRKTLFRNPVHSLTQTLLKLLEKACIQVKEASENQVSAVVEQVYHIIEKEYHSHLTVDTLAERVFYSPSYLSMIFRQQTGQTLGKALLNTRLTAAQERLKNTKESVSLIAQQCGYNDLAYFSKVFKRKYGCSPLEYRKKALRGGTK